MKKNGFTLVEILITLGVIGVVAALTMPKLMLDSDNQANAARFASTVSSLENAFTAMVTAENAENLYGTKAWGIVQGLEFNDNGNPDDINNTKKLTAGSPDEQMENFMQLLGKYLTTSGYKNENMTAYYGGNGPFALTNNGATGNISKYDTDGFLIKMKNGSTVFLRVFANGDKNTNLTEEDMNNITEQGGALTSDAADIFIDVNGNKGPNTIGRDIFTGYIDESGNFYPAGSVDVSIYDKQGTDDIWSNANANTWACLPEQNVVKNDGWGCTARVVENGYKIDY